MRKFPLLIILTLIAFWPVTMGGQPQPTDIVIELRVPATVIARVETAFAGSCNYQETVVNPAFDPSISKEIPNTQFISALPESPTNLRLIPNPAFDPTILAQIQNPETKRAFLKRMIAAYIAEVTASYEVRQAGEGARKTAQEKAGKEIKIQ